MPVCVFVLLMAGCHGCRYFAGDLNTARLEQDRACRVVALFSSNKFGGDTRLLVERDDDGDAGQVRLI